MTQQFRTAAVIGAGTIGLSWAALFAAYGLTVRVSDPRPDLAEAIAEALGQFGPQLATQGLDVDGLADRVHVASDASDAVRDAPKHALLASSSSAIPSTAFTGEIEDAGRILIGHPFNPPHLIPLVEIVPGKRTSEDAVATAVDFYTFLGRTPVVERKEMPGFVGNRLQNALNREASYLVEQGVVTPEDLDKVVTNSLGIRYATIGPFLSGHLGGGPGGYRHIAEHIGKEMDKMQLGEVTQDPEVRERLIEAVEKTYGSYSYTQLSEERDRKQLAVLTALASVNHDKKEK